MPTIAAAQPPPPFVQQQAPYPPTPASYAAAARPTLAVPTAPEAPPPAPAAGMWRAAEPHAVAAAAEPTVRPVEIDPRVLEMIASAESPPPPQFQAQAHQLPQPQVAMDHVALYPQRRGRSKLQLALWMLVGMGVIGGGVFVGFKIRGMRLDKQIAAARKRATDLAKSDTWTGWTAARDSLSGIVQASSTPGNRAALARTRGLIAFEFGDGLPEASAAVTELAGQGGRDARIAETFEALVRGDAKAARSAGDAAVAGSEGDAGAEYVAGEAALLAGDTKVAIAAMKIAADTEARPLHEIGLARAYAAASRWDEAIATIDKVRAANPEHPGAAIERASILAASGRLTPAFANELAKQLEQLIAESRQPLTQQRHGVSPTQAAFAGLALARVELARGDVAAARQAVRAAIDINIDDARFAEQTAESLYALGELVLAHTAGELAMTHYPKSARARIATAQVLLAQGKPNDAIDLLSKQADTMAYPDALAARGDAYLAIGDTVSAAADFDAALKKVPTHEPSLVGRAWLELATGELDAATQRMAERMSPKGASLAVTTAYAATLRRAGDAASRAKAKELLEAVVAGPASPEQVRAQLELARIYRDQGEFASARAAFDKAARNGGFEPRFEGALLSIDYSKPTQGRELLETLLEEAGDRPGAQLIIETARARLLVGEHALAAELLAQADKMSSVERYKLDRERGRLSLRKSDFDGAVAALLRALETCGTDSETFLLAADAAIAAPKSGLMDKVKTLAAERLKGRPEAHIVEGKLLIAAGKLDEAEAAYRRATEELAKENASYRRRAQADFGLAVVAYQRGNMAATQTALDVVLEEDPTIVDAYIFASEIAKDKKKAYAFAKKATQFNPDYAYAWLVVGRLAHDLKDKRTLADAKGRLMVIAPSGDELAELQKLR
jgi:tetratricopeptide (TPR) repeat protein